jgi:hypothetical protein
MPKFRAVQIRPGLDLSDMLLRAIACSAAEIADSALNPELGTKEHIAS